MKTTYNEPTPGVTYDRMKTHLLPSRKRDAKKLDSLISAGWEVESVTDKFGAVPTYALRRPKADRTGPEGLGSLIMRGLNKIADMDTSKMEESTARMKAENAQMKAERKAKREAKRNKH